jgi:anaerobic ribonucleoside-triphosphate reductase activating protein
MNIQEIIDDLANYPLIAGITLSGGEPFLQAKEALILAKEAHKLKLDVITYTGFTYEEILCLGPSERALLDSSDYLIDGPYLEGKKSLDLAFRGSSNQRIIDLTQTRKTKKIVLLDEFKNPILS